MSAKVPKICYKWPCTVIVMHSAQMGYKGSQGALVKINGKAIFSYKMHFLIDCHTVALDAAEVKHFVL